MSGKIKIQITVGKDSDDVYVLRDELSDLQSDEDVEIVEIRENDDTDTPIKVSVKSDCGEKKFIYKSRGDIVKAINEVSCKF